MPAIEDGYSFGKYVPDKAEVLSMATEEYLFEQMGVPLEEGIFISPFRDDHNPTCSLWRSPKGRLYFTDWAVDRPMDVFRLAQYVYGCDEQKALRTLYDLAKGYNHNTNIDRKRQIKPAINRPCEIRVRRQDWTKEALEWWSRFGIDRKTLSFYRVAQLDMAWFNGNVIFMHPYGKGYVYDFLDHDYKLYFPEKETYRFLHNRADLLQGYDQLPDEGEFLVITKSLKDVMHFRCVHQIPAVAPMAETVIVSQDQIRELEGRFNTILCFMDNDLPGLRALRKYKQLGLQICMIPKRWNAKDITDFYRKYTLAKTCQLIEQAKQFYLPFKEEEDASNKC